MPKPAAFPERRVSSPAGELTCHLHKRLIYTNGTLFNLQVEELE